MKLERIEGAEISANRQFVVRDECGGISITRHFGGRTSRSGATIWPEWIQDSAFEIKPLGCVTENDLAGERIVCFSGGGYQLGVRIYDAYSEAVKEELEKWRRWRRFEPSEPTPTEDDRQADRQPPKRKQPLANQEDQKVEDEPRAFNDAGQTPRTAW